LEQEKEKCKIDLLRPVDKKSIMSLAKIDILKKNIIAKK